MGQSLGSVYTSNEVANLLTSWAIRSSTDTILDLGVGGGAFTFSSLQALIQRGAIFESSCPQIYGSEIDEAAYDNFKAIADEKETIFPNVVRADFFKHTFPTVDVVVGNPPYVRRRQISENKSAEIHNAVLSANQDVLPEDLTKLTDHYVYFILKASALLKVGGYMAVVISDSWMNVKYGEVLRNHLKTNFEIERLIYFDRAIFYDAQVKPVLLFAKKVYTPNPDSNVKFTRVFNGLPVSRLKSLVSGQDELLVDIKTTSVNLGSLQPEKSWNVYFKLSRVIFELEKNKKLTTVENLFNVRIGLQTLADKFFVIDENENSDHGIEQQYLFPYISSLSGFKEREIDSCKKTPQRVFLCSIPKGLLAKSGALKHINAGESQKVEIRGKNGQTVIGYQNKPRIQKTSRIHWYDVKTEVDGRDRGQIFIPRLIYNDYVAVWNSAGAVAGGSIIEIVPKILEYDVRLLLAVFNSTLMEVLIRGYAQLYGGGSSTLGVRALQKIWFPDVQAMNMKTKTTLIAAYEHFLVTGKRGLIDRTIWKFLSINAKPFHSTLAELLRLAHEAKRKNKQNI